MIETPRIEIKRAAQRLETDTYWLESRHCFSFGGAFEPANQNHSLLLVSNDDIVKPGFGFETHPHRDMEIVTWVLDGELEHTDTVGNHDIIYPGLAQRMSAGRGIWHSEMNPSKDKNARFVQMWVLPDTESVDPSYEQLEVMTELSSGDLFPIASGRDEHAAIKIRQKGAVLWGGRLAPGKHVNVPDAPYVHIYIARGEVTLDGAGVLEEGDAVRLIAAGSPELTTGPEGAEVLIWELAEPGIAG
ncbi:MAG: pirin family protein [Chloroflexi bacterium]|nr:pirin family protein [Chloroflexota bacterium]